MIKHLADWIRQINIDPTDAMLKARMAGIESLDKKSLPSDVPELVRIYRGRPTMGADFPARFEKAFNDADNAFTLKSAATAMQVLAGAALFASSPTTTSEPT
ncbi:MAG: hypothetical protein QM783_15900 [Phycisphaerales bacterium]